MLVLRGPTKADLIFTEEPHVKEPPWEPSHENLEAIEAHFWDWMLWLRSKEAGGKAQLVEGELDKLFSHLLAPLGATRRPSSVHDAIATHRASRRRAEQRFGVVANHALEDAVAHAFEP